MTRSEERFREAAATAEFEDESVDALIAELREAGFEFYDDRAYGVPVEAGLIANTLGREGRWHTKRVMRTPWEPDQ